MSRSIPRSSIVVLAFSLMLTGICSSSGWATVREVPTTYATIQAAITAASAGDTIRVYEGTYIGPINVDRSLVLIGDRDTGTTIIQAPVGFDTATAYNYSLAHFTTERPIVHIGTSTPISVVITGFVIDGMRRGPARDQLVSYSAILAEQCTVTVTGDSIRNILPADSAGSTWIQDNPYNGRGIHVRGSGAVATITGNHITDVNRIHIYVNASDDGTPPTVFPRAVVSGNTILGKGLYDGGQKGIWFNRGAWGTISGNTVSNLDFTNPAIEPDRASGIVIRYGSDNTAQTTTISSNTVSASTSVNNKGIYVQGTADTVVGNNVSGYRFNIELHDAPNVLVKGNTVSGGVFGIILSTEPNRYPSSDQITIGGSPQNRNSITGQSAFAISMSYRDLNGDNFLSTVPVTATFNDFGVYADSLVALRIFDRRDTTTSPYNMDTVHYWPFYTPTLRTAVKVLLQGPYTATGDSMFGTLNTSGALSAHFGAVPIPSRAVDSISIELRNAVTGSGSTFRKFAPAWLLTDGSIRDFSDTASYVQFDTTVTGFFYTVVHHRNHLAVMDSIAQPIDGSTGPSVYDFTTAQNKAYGTNPMAPVGTRFAMVAGDGNNSGIISAADANLVFGALNATGYNANDLNVSGIVSAADANIVFGNLSRVSQVP